MAEYRVDLTRSASRDLDSLDQGIGRRLIAAIESLAVDPRPRQAAKLTGSLSSYRVRVGNYRVLYEVSDGRQTVTVFAAGHRRDVYRSLR